MTYLTDRELRGTKSFALQHQGIQDDDALRSRRDLLITSYGQQDAAPDSPERTA